MDDDFEINKLWRIRKALMQILNVRGYLVPPEQLEQTFDQFKETFGDKPSENRPARADLGILLPHKKDPTEQTRVFFPNEFICSVKTINTCHDDMKAGNIHRGIIVVQSGLTTWAKQALEAKTPEFQLEAFLESELLEAQHNGTETGAATCNNKRSGNRQVARLTRTF